MVEHEYRTLRVSLAVDGEDLVFGIHRVIDMLFVDIDWLRGDAWTTVGGDFVVVADPVAQGESHVEILGHHGRRNFGQCTMHMRIT